MRRSWYGKLIFIAVIPMRCSQWHSATCPCHFAFQFENLIPIGMKIAFQPYILGGMACYAVSLVVWIMALSRVPVSIAYPMLSIGYVVNAAVAYLWFGEPLVAQKLLGLGFIVVGVILVARS